LQSWQIFEEWEGKQKKIRSKPNKTKKKKLNIFMGIFI